MDETSSILGSQDQLKNPILCLPLRLLTIAPMFHMPLDLQHDQIAFAAKPQVLFAFTYMLKFPLLESRHFVLPLLTCSDWLSCKAATSFC